MIQLTDNDPNSQVNLGDMIDTKDHGTGVLESLYDGKLNIRVGKELFTVDRKDCKKSDKRKPSEVVDKDRYFNQLAQDPVKLPAERNAEYSPKDHATVEEEKKAEENRQIQRDRMMEHQQRAQTVRQEESNLAVKKEEEAIKVNEAAKKEREKLEIESLVQFPVSSGRLEADERAKLEVKPVVQQAVAARAQPQSQQTSNVDKILADQKAQREKLAKEAEAKKQEELKKNEQASD